MIGVVAVELLADQDRGFFAGELPVSVGIEVCQDLPEVAVWPPS
jgi:hypothetical protein